MKINNVDPVADIGHLLLGIEKPARYTGGEYGRIAKKDAGLKTIIAFPDLYEIGMSNQALRIIYNRLNNIEGISCDRAFAPAPDFEELLKKKGLPLYGLDTGISLKNADLLMFTLGYELGITGIFSILEVSGIPLRCLDRKTDDPIIIMGGPCVSNPLPYADFIDVFWIGEAEGGFFELMQKVSELKKSGAKKDALLKCLIEHPSIWTKGKGRAVRAIDADFSNGKNGPAIFPVPSMKVVQHHGAVEIMRGCPNGCRFCHAGYWYRPMRQKNAEIVKSETEAFICRGGYREITLSSLSSGDYQHLDNLIDSLNSKFQNQRVSFQLPSLKVSSFSLNLLEKISEVRKSGLTFAVETPADFCQMAINKQVSAEHIVSILKEAKRRGWRGAKFYFMLGLPLANLEKPEQEEIADFIEKIAGLTRMHFNINIGTFVPKPHTAFQWAGQMPREEAVKKLNYLRFRLKPKGHKVGIQDPMISVIEGITSRGDERAGQIFEEAFQLGCRLDSWGEYLKRDIWENLLEKNKVLVEEILSKKDPQNPLPWQSIFSGHGEKFFCTEFEKSKIGEITLPCIKKCNGTCGACSNSVQLVQNIIQEEDKTTEFAAYGHASHGLEFHREEEITLSKTQCFSTHAVPSVTNKKPDPDTSRIIFSFSKQGSAVFHSHLGLLEMFFMSFIRSRLPVLYSLGFNPLPRLEIASPLSLGISAKAEIAAIDTEGFFDAQKFKSALNNFLPEGLEIIEAMNVHIPSGGKKHSLSSLLWGFTYGGKDGEIDIVSAKEEKAYRASRLVVDGSLFKLERLSVLARQQGSQSASQLVSATQLAAGVSYFDVYSALYPATATTS